MDKNQKVWNSAGVVDIYMRRINEGVQKPEAAILDMLGDLSEASLLDIGVGTGRTTAFLNKKVGHYTGIDYSEKMIESCKKLFNNTNLALKQADARRLSEFLDNSFDICFFSFNGIDYITDIGEREDAIREIWRVLKPEGYFIFSSHNLYNLPMRTNLFHPEKDFSYSIRCIIRSLIFHSRDIFTWNSANADYLVINDGALRFRLNTFYVKPEFQIRQLSAHNFFQIKVFDLYGRQVQDHFDSTSGDYYLYYSCKKKGV